MEFLDWSPQSAQKMEKILKLSWKILSEANYIKNKLL